MSINEPSLEAALISGGGIVAKDAFVSSVNPQMDWSVEEATEECCSTMKCVSQCVSLVETKADLLVSVKRIVFNESQYKSCIEEKKINRLSKRQKFQSFERFYCKNMKGITFLFV